MHLDVSMHDIAGRLLYTSVADFQGQAQNEARYAPIWVQTW